MNWKNRLKVDRFPREKTEEEKFVYTAEKLSKALEIDRKENKTVEEKAISATANVLNEWEKKNETKK